MEETEDDLLRVLPAMSLDWDVRPNRPQLPAFCSRMFTLDIVLSGIRGLLGVYALVSAPVRIGDDPVPPLQDTLRLEVLSAFSVCILGVTAGLCLLRGSAWAIWLALAAVAATVVSMGIQLWQTKLLQEAMLRNGEEAAGLDVTIGSLTALRFALLVLYVTALARYPHQERGSGG